MTDAIIVALVTGGLSLTGTLIGTWATTKRTTDLILYRIEQLEKKVETHNHLVDRTYKLEERTEIQEQAIKIINRRLGDG